LLPGIAAEQAAESGGSDVQRLGGILVQLYLDGPFAASKNLDGCNPIDIFQLRYDLLVHYVAHPVDAPRTAHLKRHEGAVRPREVHLLHAHGKALREGWGNL